MKRNRMIVDIPVDVQMAIRLQAIKQQVTTGEVVAQAVEKVFPDDLREARETLSEKENPCPFR